MKKLLLLPFIFSTFLCFSQLTLEPGRIFFTEVSENGDKAVASSSLGVSLWSEANGLETIFQNSPSGNPGISNDGNIIASTIVDNDLAVAAVYDQNSNSWTPIGEDLGGSSGNSVTSAWGLSGNGQKLVGLGWIDPGTAHGFVWDQTNGIVDLGSSVPDRSTRANAVSYDGSIIVGWQDGITGFRQGAVWSNGIQTLIFNLDGSEAREASCVSDDGEWVGGGSSSFPWRWNSITSEMQEIGPNPTPGVYVNNSTTGLNQDGSIAVGYFRPQATLYGEGFIWVEGENNNQVYNLNDYAESLGIDTQGVNLALPLGISANGNFVVGTGIDDDFNEYGFILDISNSLSVNDHPAEIFSVYPNPTSSTLKIQSNHEVEGLVIYSVTGKHVKRDSGQEIDVSNLAPGIYLVSIYSKGQVITKKFIKS